MRPFGHMGTGNFPHDKDFPERYGVPSAAQVCAGYKVSFHIRFQQTKRLAQRNISPHLPPEGATVYSSPKLPRLRWIPSLLIKA